MPGNRTRHSRRLLRPQLEPLEDRTLFAFGVTTGTTPTGQSTYVIDNGGDLKFSVIKGGSTTSTIHLGDVSSIQFKGKEMLATYAETSRYSHYEQGLGSASTISYTIGGNNSWILVTCDDSAASSGAVIQYYAVRKGDNNIYMASLPLDVTNGPGEGRFIAYLERSVFSSPEAPSDNAGSSGAIEGSDVFGHPDGTTTSKFYNMGRRMIDNVYHGLTGTAGTQTVGAWMYMGNRETSSGGPFFKDIDYQSSDSQVEIYNCLFTGHTQTEPFRQGLKGPYAFQFTDGSAPADPDYSWMDALNLQGWTPAAGRGTLAGTASGVPAGHDVVVGLANSTAQYWIRPDSAGHYSLTGILPGTYTETLYDTELGVGTKTVTISANATTNANITDTFYIPASPIFRIGTWDGTPIGFLNSEKIETMHPSDVRMASWTSTPNFVIGTNSDADWPMVEFMGVNNNQRITFTLTSAQVQNLTLRIGITLGFEGARPRVTVNAGQTYAWTSAIPSASNDLNSRGITRGTWRGNNQLYTFNIPSSALRAGTNTIDLPMVSGSYQAGQTWLSPNAAFDAIDLIPTTSASAPTIASVTVTPANSTAAPNTGITYTAVAKDSTGHVIPANFNWSATRGTIDPNGNFTAPATAGNYTITATAIETRIPGYTSSSSSTSSYGTTLTGTGTTTVNVLVNNAPTIATQASATPNPTNGTSATLSVLGADDAGESSLTYTWSAVGTPPDPVTFSSNGTNAAKTTTATFTRSGTYTLQATITDAGALSTTSTVTLIVNLGLFADSRDVGSPATPGSLSFNPSTGTYTIKGNGSDIWSTSDQFRYTYATLPGNGQMIARVTSVTNTSSSAKAGVMLRDSADPGAAYAFVWLSPGNLVKFETRAANGTTSSYSASLPAAAPVYLKLLRSGPTNNQFAAYYSPDNTTWTQVGLPQTVTMASTALAGLAVTSHSATTLNTATFDNLSLTPIVTGDQSSPDQPDSFLLTRNGPYLDLYLNNTTTTPTYRYDANAVTSLILTGQTGPDTLTLNFTDDGSPLPPNGLSTDIETVTAPYTGPTPVAAIRRALATGQLSNPAATGLQRLGYIDTGTSVDLKLTTPGDANLDGKIDADDYALIDRGLAKHLTTWTAGDFNYDGTINAADYLLLDTAFQQQQGGQPSPELLAEREAQFGPDYATALESALAPTPTITGPAPGPTVRHTPKAPGPYAITPQATNQSNPTSQPATLSILIQPLDPSKNRAHLFFKSTAAQSLFAAIEEKNKP